MPRPSLLPHSQSALPRPLSLAGASRARRLLLERARAFDSAAVDNSRRARAISVSFLYSSRSTIIHPHNILQIYAVLHTLNDAITGYFRQL